MGCNCDEGNRMQIGGCHRSDGLWRSITNVVKELNTFIAWVYACSEFLFVCLCSDVLTILVDCIERESVFFCWWHYPLPITTMNIVLKVSHRGIYWGKSKQWLNVLTASHTHWTTYRCKTEIRWSQCVTSKFVCGEIVLTAGGKFLAAKDVKHHKWITRFCCFPFVSQVCHTRLRIRGVEQVCHAFLEWCSRCTFAVAESAEQGLRVSSCCNNIHIKPSVQASSPNFVHLCAL